MSTLRSDCPADPWERQALLTASESTAPAGPRLGCAALGCEPKIIVSISPSHYSLLSCLPPVSFCSSPARLLSRSFSLVLLRLCLPLSCVPPASLFATALPLPCFSPPLLLYTILLPRNMWRLRPDSHFTSATRCSFHFGFHRRCTVISSCIVC